MIGPPRGDSTEPNGFRRTLIPDARAGAAARGDYAITEVYADTLMSQRALGSKPCQVMNSFDMA